MLWTVPENFNADEHVELIHTVGRDALRGLFGDLVGGRTGATDGFADEVVELIADAESSSIPKVVALGYFLGWAIGEGLEQLDLLERVKGLRIELEDLEEDE